MKRFSILSWLWALLIAVLLAHGAWQWFGQRVTPDTDILALLPTQERDPVLQKAFSSMVDAAQQRVIVLIGAEDWTQATRAADAYLSVLKPHGDLLKITQGIDNQDWLAPLNGHRLVLLAAEDDAALVSRSAQDWSGQALTRLASPFAGPKLGSWQDDPFGLFGNWVAARAQETPVRPRDGRLTVVDGARQYVVLPVTLRDPAFSVAAQRAVMPVLAAAREAAQRAVPTAEVLAGGVVLHAAAAGEQANREVSIIGVGSMFGIVLLMWFTFRSIKPILFITLSLAIGCLGAWSVCLLMFRHIHLMTLVFGASLIGVAQDYGIYYLCNRIDADSSEDALQLLKRLTPGLTLTFVTTVIGYLGLALTPFPGLQQMAVFSIVGLLFAWLTVMLWFPTLIGPKSLSGVRTAKRRTVDLSRWPRLGFDRRTALLALPIVAVLTFGIGRIGTNDDIRLLQNPPKQLIDEQVRISKLLDTPGPAQFFLVRGATPELVLQREEILKQRLAPLVADHTITGVQAMSNWVPSLQTQRARRQAIEQHLLNDSGPLAAVATAIGEDTSWTGATRARLLAMAEPLTPDVFLTMPASEPWRHLWLSKIDGDKNGPVYASVVALRGLSTVNLPRLSGIADGLDGVQWVDKVGEISSVLGRYRFQMAWVILISYLGVYCLLYPRYRRHAWRVLAPTALASAVILALFGIAGQPLQLFHVLALMLILGIGVDYGIFLHEYADARESTPWQAIRLSAISTLLSFGLLGLSNTPALRAFGITMAVGVVLVWIIMPCFRRGE